MNICHGRKNNRFDETVNKCNCLIRNIGFNELFRSLVFYLFFMIFAIWTSLSACLLNFSLQFVLNWMKRVILLVVVGDYGQRLFNFSHSLMITIVIKCNLILCSTLHCPNDFYDIILIMNTTSTDGWLLQVAVKKSSWWLHSQIFSHWI